MAEKLTVNSASDMFESLFRGTENFISSKTVVGEPIFIDGAAIIPLMDVSCGLGAGAFNKEKDSMAGAMSAKMSPCAVLIVQNGTSKLISVNNQDAVSKILDMVPDLINKITGDKKISPKAEAEAEKLAEEAQIITEVIPQE